MLKKRILQSCHFLLQPLVRFLLRHGVTWEEFAELSKDTYVHVAREEHGIQGRPTNNSRVAMLTGLSRREVARVRDRLQQGEVDDDALHGNRLSRILSGWHTDPDFTGDDGRPADLANDDSESGFETLLRRYAGDLPHGAVRKELLQRGLIEELNDDRIRVLKRDFVISSTDPAMVRQFALALHDHAATLEHNLDDDRDGSPRFEGMADNISMPRRTAKKFEELVARRGLSFLEEIDTWLSDNEQDDGDDRRTVRLGVGIYLIHDENQKDH